jgi:PAS domain S-box-containing protein
MIMGVLKVKGFNWPIYILMGVQLALLLGIIVILLSAITPSLDMSTIISAVVIFMLGLPMLVLLYISSADRLVKKVLFGLTFSLALLSLSGIMWYILAGNLNAPWLISVAKIIMVVCYVPIIYVLYDVTKMGPKKLDMYPKALLVFVNVMCIIMILYYMVTRFNISNAFDISIYLFALLGDLAVLNLASMLVVIFKHIQLRYLLATIFIYNLFSMAGDSLNLATALQAVTYDASGFAQIFYNVMLVFLTVALLVYSLFKNVNATTVEEVNKKLDDTRHFMDDLIMQSPEAVCIFDPEGNVVIANEPFLNMFGVERSRLIGTFNLFRHAEKANYEHSVKIPGLRQGETIVIDKIKMPLPSRSNRCLSIKIFPAYDSGGTISGFISISDDITARVLADEELKQAKALAELYIDLMGHDINNMNQVGMGYLEIALNTMDIGEDKKKLLAKPLEAMKNSSRLIDNVKKLRRANEGDMYLRTVDLGKVLKDVIAEHSQAPDKDVTIQYDVADNTMVKANELLKDVFVNLVSNAIKHSDGAVKLNIRQEPVDVEGKKYYRITVEDDGPGIPDELKPVIFDRLLRGRAKVGGNGIGLYLVKTLVDNFGGTIAVEDRMPGERMRGTRFIVTLPAA